MARIRIDSSSRLPLDAPEPLTVHTPARRSEPSEPKAASNYVELCARTNFSFLRGAAPPETIVERAAELGYSAIGITDCDGLYGIVRAHEKAVACAIRLVVGCELSLSDVDRPRMGSRAITVHVENAAGYTNLCRLLTESHRRFPKGQPRGGRASHHELARNSYAGLDVKTICENADGLWPILHDPFDEDAIALLREAFGERLSLGVFHHLDGDSAKRQQMAEQCGRRFNVPVCAHNRVLYAVADHKPILDVLHCIREGTSLDAAGRALLPNTQAHLKSADEMGRLFHNHPEWLARSVDIAAACTFNVKSLRYCFPSELDEPAFVGETSDQALRRLTYEGAEKRYNGELPEKTKLQIEKELALIAKLEVAPYFLSVQSIVNIARKRDILCQGRGSAANSAVCYCLGITAVDPARSNLLFERFLSGERQEPPDIDVDFEHERREEVIQDIYEKYGRERAAMVSEVICYRGKSALRDVGKVFGFSLEQVERMSSLIAWWDSISKLPDERIRQVGFDPEDARIRQVLAFARMIQGFPRHLSIHVGGFVLSAEPLVHVAPIEPATMPGRTIIPWDKDDLDTLGFFKVDVLGLGMLSAIRRTLALAQYDDRIRANTAIDRLAEIPPEDPVVYDALCKADTVGVFQIESRAQMAMLPRLKPRTFYDIVVEVAIVRPGPIQGGMIHPYLKRRNGLEPATTPHPCLDPILARTLGVPLFQEQVMQIAIVGAGYTGGEADQLRRDMAAWRKDGRLERHQERLIRGFLEKGIPRDFGERIYSQIKGFGEYGFPESHAASFALLVYASSWLKVHHPAAFAAGLINSQPMGFYSPNTILQDARRHGVTVRPICVNASDWDCTLERNEGEEPKLRVGLLQVRGLSKETGQRIESAKRERRFSSVEDLTLRTALRKNELEVLARAGALESIMPGVEGRRDAIWKVRAPREEGLFAGKSIGEPLPSLRAMSRGEQLALDYASTGVSVDEHPMHIVRSSLPKHVRSSSQLETLPPGGTIQVAGMVICRQRPMTASGIVFMTLEDEAGFMNLVLFANKFEQYRYVATSSSLVLVTGKLEREGGVVHVIVERIEPLNRASLPAQMFPSMSRDFH